MALTDEQLEMLGERLVPLYQQLERDVINDIARRLMKTGTLTETAEIMAESLRLKGFSPAAIRREVMKLIRADKKAQRQIERDTLEYKQLLKKRIAETNAALGEETETLWEDAGNLAFHEDLSVWQGDALPVRGGAFERLVKAMAKSAGGDLLNLTKSAGFRTADGDLVKARQAYTQELNRAFVKLSSGAFSWQQCVEDAVKELAGSGLRTVDFDSGVSRQIDTAVRTSVMTASAQLAGQISMKNCEEGGAEYVEVSAHWGARTGEGHANHAGWQGKVYRLEGSEPDYPNLEEETGYPSDPRGLLGYNCRHTFSPFWPGLSEPTDWPKEPAPVTVDGKTYTYYEATQEQRRREREIRALKREESALKAAGMEEKAREKRALIRQKVAEYEEFSRDVGIRAKNERLRVCETQNWLEMSKPRGHAVGNWPKGGNVITEEELKSLQSYAKERGVKLVSFEHFDGDQTIVREFADVVSEIAKGYPKVFGKNGYVQIHNSYGMEAADYAMTVNGKIVLNNAIMRDKALLERDYSEKAASGWFCRNTTYRSIAAHEMGHVIAYCYRLPIKSIVKGLDPSNLSEYAAMSESEMIAETFSSVYSSAEKNQTALTIKALCDKIILQRG